MPKQDSIEVEGRVIEPLPNAMFRVEVEGDVYKRQGVALETMKQIESQLVMRNYQGFLK